MPSETVVGTCHHDCPDTCGWIATAEDGVLTSVRGNPEHPFSAGELCPKVNKLVARVNSDDRLLSPLIRTGRKGAGEFREAGWDEALSTIVARTNEARDRFGGQTILPWHSAGTQGMIQQSSLDRALFAALGSSVQIGSICGATAGAGMAATYGHGHGADPLNIEHAQMMILWGTNTRLTNRHLWPYVERARANGAELVVIDPVRTITADSADRFLQPLPGTDVALMLAMMHVIIAEDLVDHDYVDQHALGFDDLSTHVESCDPEWAAAVCGIPAEEIRRLAIDYGTARPAFIRTLIGAEHHLAGAMFYRTVSCLPVLTGSWKHLGGGVARSCGSWSEIDDVRFGAYERPDLSNGAERRGLLQPQLGRSLTELDDPPVTVLFVWGGNPLVSLPNSGATRRGLERDDLFTVVSEQFMTDTARFADVLLPAATQPENLDVVPSWGHLWLGWNEPATEPRGDSVSNTEMWRRLAAAFGFTDPHHYLSDLELIELGLGDRVDIDRLRRDGFVRVSGTEELMPYSDGSFGTADGRALLRNDALAGMGQPPLPTFTPSSEALGRESRYPLQLISPKKQLRFMNTTYSAMPGHGDRESGPFIELHPADAGARGLEAGSRARIFNDRGSLELEVAITDRLRPGLVSVPWGWWSTQYGDDGSVVNDLTNDGDTDWGGGAAYGDTLVEVSAI